MQIFVSLSLVTLTYCLNVNFKDKMLAPQVLTQHILINSSAWYFFSVFALNTEQLFCFNCSSCVCDEISTTKATSGRNSLSWLMVQGYSPIMAAKPREMELEPYVHHIHRQDQKEVSTCQGSGHALHFLNPASSTCGMVLLTMKIGLTVSISIIKISFYIYVQGSACRSPRHSLIFTVS